MNSRDCEVCGEPNDTADVLGEIFSGLVKSEVPNPTNVLHDQLRQNFEKRQQEIATHGRKGR